MRPRYIILWINRRLDRRGEYRPTGKPTCIERVNCCDPRSAFRHPSAL